MPARASAWLAGRAYVDPEDVRGVAHAVLRHRLILSYDALAEGISSDAVIDELLQPGGCRLTGGVMRWLRPQSDIARRCAGQPRVAASLAHLRALEFRARGFSFLPRQPARSILTGRHSSRLRGRGLNFEELRHYQPGDDIRSMDWKVTNRTGKPHVRVYTEERERSVLPARRPARQHVLRQPSAP
jgi:hypothetical protein